MQQSVSSVRAWLVLLALVAITFGATTGASFFFPLASRNDFNVVDWELRHLPGKWLYLGGQLVRGKPSRAEQDARLALYLDLTAQIERLQSAPKDSANAGEIAALSKRRQEIENDVEATVASRITSVLEDGGLTSSVPLFPDARWVWPPVAVEFDAPPNELAISPRDHIELIDDRPLRHDLSPSQIVDVESGVEHDGLLSAIIEPLEGISTYPSLVDPSSDYQQLVETAAHEWVHEYLFFHPLGIRYTNSLELRTLNETVATLAGQELGLLVVVKYPLQPPYESAALEQGPNVDVAAVLRQLRADVDALLAFGQIEKAEQLMDLRRQELASEGVVFRRINQAFFAFENIYATSPGSTDPIGLKIAALRVRTGSIGAFLRAASRLTNESDLDRELQGG